MLVSNVLFSCDQLLCESFSHDIIPLAVLARYLYLPNAQASASNTLKKEKQRACSNAIENNGDIVNSSVVVLPSECHPIPRRMDAAAVLIFCRNANKRNPHDYSFNASPFCKQGPCLVDGSWPINT